MIRPSDYNLDYWVGDKLNYEDLIEENIYEQFLKHIKQESLSGNMEYAFKNNDDLLSNFKKRLSLSMTYREIAEECSGIRNTIDHEKKIKI